MSEMTQYVFAEQVTQHFHYLIDDYGFSVVDQKYEPEAFGNSLIQFRSSAIDIMFVLDRGQVLVDISPYPNPPNYQFGLATVVKFLAPEADEPAYIFPETWEDYDGMVEWQLTRLARVLRQYCVPVLSGEFSDWKTMNECRRREAEEGYRRLTGKDPIKVASK